MTLSLTLTLTPDPDPDPNPNPNPDPNPNPNPNPNPILTQGGACGAEGGVAERRLDALPLALPQGLPRPQDRLPEPEVPQLP